MIFLARGNRGPDPFLSWKVQIFLAAGVLAVLGIGMESSLLVSLAIALLLAGVGLRLIGRYRRDGPEAGEDQENTHEL